MFIPSWEYWFLWNFPLAQQMEIGHVNFNYSIICMFRDLHKKFQMIIITFFKKDKIISIYFWRHYWPLLLIISLFDFMCFLKNYCVLSKKICFKSGTISDGSLKPAEARSIIIVTDGDHTANTCLTIMWHSLWNWANLNHTYSMTFIEQKLFPDYSDFTAVIPLSLTVPPLLWAKHWSRKAACQLSLETGFHKLPDRNRIIRGMRSVSIFYTFILMWLTAD